MLKIWLSVCTLLSAILTTLLWYFGKFEETANLITFVTSCVFFTLCFITISFAPILVELMEEDYRRNNKED